MELKINVDETKFGEVLQKELDALSKEELVSLVKDGLREMLIGDTAKSYDQSILLKFFIEKQNSYYGSSSFRPSSILEGIIKNAAEDKDAWKDLISELQDEIIRVLKENYKDIIMKTFIKMFTESLSKNVVETGSFMSSFSNLIAQEFYSHVENFHNRN